MAALRAYIDDWLEESTNRLAKKDNAKLHDLEMDREGINELTDYLVKIENVLTEKIRFRKES